MANGDNRDGPPKVRWRFERRSKALEEERKRRQPARRRRKQARLLGTSPEEKLADKGEDLKDVEIAKQLWQLEKDRLLTIQERARATIAAAKAADDRKQLEVGALEEIIKKQNKLIAAEQAGVDEATKKVNTLEEESQKIQKVIRHQVHYNKQLEVSNEMVDSIGTKLGLQKSQIGETIKKTRKMHRSFVRVHGSAVATGMMLKTFTKSIMTALHPLNVLESIMTKIWYETWEIFVRSSKAISQMNGAIGDTSTLSKAAGRAVRFSMGVEIEEATQAAAGLASTLTSLTSMSQATQTGLIGVAAELERVGVGAGDTGQGMNFLTRSMGMATGKAQKQWKMMAVQAQAFGKVPGQFSSEFLAATKVLTAHGPKMMEVFLDLESVAMASGIAVDKLLSIAGKFDTFDSAATAVGNLNALLGGDYMNTLEMMNMTEGERVKALKASLEMAGKNFDQMERFERKAIAESLAMDEAELAAMMNMSGREARKAARDAKRKEKDQKAYNKMIKQTVDIMKSLRMLYTSIFAKTGLAKAFGRAFKQIFKFFDPKEKTGKAVKQLTDSLGDFMVLVVDLALNWFKDLIGDGEGFANTITKITGVIEGLQDAMTEKDPKLFAKRLTEGIEMLQKDLLKFLTGPKMQPIRDAFTMLIAEPMGEAVESMMEGMFQKFGKNLQNSKHYSARFLGDILADMGTPGDKKKKRTSGGASVEKQWPKLFKEMKTFQSHGGTKNAFMNSTSMRNASAKARQAFEDEWQINSDSGVTAAWGKHLEGGYKNNFHPNVMAQTMQNLTNSTLAWGEAVKTAAASAATVQGPAAAGAAGGGGGDIVLKLDGEVLAKYVMGAVESRANTIAKQA